MNEYGELLAPDTVRFVRLLPGTLDTVWPYLVDGEKRKKWLADGDTEERVGGRVDLIFRNSTLSSAEDDPPPEKYRDYQEPMTYQGEVVACVPKTLLTHTWVDGEQQSEVTYQLEQRDDGVLLTLTHRRLGNDMILGVLGGWHTHLDILVDILSNRRPKPFWRTHTALENEYEERVG